jgi:antitoxin VapB
MFPLATFDSIEVHYANELLVRWSHKMGALERGNISQQHAHALFAHGEPVAVVTTSSLIRECVGGGMGHLTRDNTVELSRLCAAEPWACRVALRLWREVVFPGIGVPYAVSYQDAVMHSGNIYRFDGWKREGFSSSGTDQRTGRKGRRKWIWLWERPAIAMRGAA